MIEILTRIWIWIIAVNHAKTSKFNKAFEFSMVSSYYPYNIHNNMSCFLSHPAFMLLRTMFILLYYMVYVYDQLLQNFAWMLGIPPVTCAHSFGVTILSHAENGWAMQNFWSTPYATVSILQCVGYEDLFFVLKASKGTQ